ncbi:HK97-gp10 family putative phage morphogenesis protein [Pragia fontium]|uniref:HK97-gp10 family putative phage morphogenesis protein n=1 Tax=Pragia fontium TaxID=82985 RepID=UPI00064B206F|nr:HK97-gp10 family putative phage morphogenesis protein [Pragia fontium]AKJ41551.1 hypothetical protein QQ39_05200 [Pragia fontium]
MNHKFDILGLKELERDLIKLSKAETTQVKRIATRAGAAVFRDEAKRLAPRDTGELKQNIKIAGVKGEIDSGVIIPKAFWWRFVEYGTSKMAAKPFLRIAFESAQEQAAEATINKLAESIDKVLMK